MTRWQNPFRLRALRAEAEAAAAQKQAADAAKQDADHRHHEALEKLQAATALAEKLGGMDRRNHYSESLTHAFRGRPA
jgi:hypothetical protein